MQKLQRWVPLPEPPQSDTEAVLQRARSRLQEAEEPPPPPPPRQLHPPVLVMQPADLRVMLGRVAEFCVHAQVSGCALPDWGGTGFLLSSACTPR